MSINLEMFMTFLSGLSRRTATALTLAIGFAAGGAAFMASTPAPKAAATMSILDQLEAKEEIRSQLMLYGLLAEGDGFHPRDTNALMEKIMAPDVISEQYFPDGSPVFPPRQGRDENKQYTQPPRDLSKIGEQHYTVGVYFDELTPTHAKTRSQQIFITVSKNTPDPDCNNTCGGLVKHIQMNDYFDTWEKTAQGWQKVKTVIRSIN